MRVLSRGLVVALGGVAGGVLGGMVGVAMDRFPALGLAPASFWGADPENVWAWSVVAGGALGIALTALALRSLARRPGTGAGA